MKNLMQVFRIVTIALLGWTSLAVGQTFSSGSTGADGAYAPSCAPTPCTVVEPLNATGTYNYTTVTIPAGVTVRYTRNAANTPVTILASGDVTINGGINLNVGDGLVAVVNGATARPGGLGGPGGFNGGNGGILGGASPSAGQGPGGTDFSNASYGAPATFVTLIPLFGGSGAGGTAGVNAQGTIYSGPSGGGGGGAVVIASSSKIVFASTGVIAANGGAAAGGPIAGSAGSGGAIRLVAPQISGSGTLQANVGSGGFGAGPGRIRLEAFSLGFTGTASPASSQSVVPGPVNAASNPALIALPTLAIASVGGVASPPVPAGSYAAADVAVPQGTANPVPVVVTATNMPTSAAVRVRLMPQSGTASTTPPITPAGTFQSSTVTAGITFPLGTVSVVQAWATMTLTGQIASLFPLIDGEPVESVAVASPLGDGKPVINLVTKSGREKRFDELTSADQAKVVVAWQMLAASR